MRAKLEILILCPFIPAAGAIALLALLTGFICPCG